MDGHHLVDNLALHLESAFLISSYVLPFPYFFCFGWVLLYHHLISFFPSATQKWDMLSEAIKICWQGGKESFLRFFCIVGFLVLRAYRFPFYTSLDKMLERWRQRRVPRGHGLAIVGNLYSLFIKECCLAFTVLFYLSEGWILG
jgi:hypothetical protein